MFKKYKWPLLALIAITIIGYCILHHIRYSPRLNPHPKYFVTIKGTVSPQLQDKIRFYITYASSKKHCEKQGFNVNYDLAKSIDVKPKFNANNQYKTVITLDKYNPGWCGWNVASYEYYLLPKKNKKPWIIPVILFGNTLFSQTNSLDFTCKPNKPKCVSQHLFEDNSMLIKPSTGIYSITINFKEE